MADIAAKTLVTSKGTIPAGGEIPQLGKGEMEKIRSQGGIAKIPPRTAEPDKSEAYASAVEELQAAEAAVTSAKTEEEKKAADERLTSARRTLFAM